MIRVLNWIREIAAFRSEFAASDPSGRFMIKRNMVTGWVDGIPGHSKYPIKIEVFRQASLLISHEATFDATKEIYPFSFETNNKFTEEDIIKEKVRIVARSARSKVATLNLDPALQIDLMRRYLSGPTETVLDIDFDSSGVGHQYLDQGWSIPGRDATWTEGTQSTILFPSPSNVGMFLLRLRFAAFIAPPGVPRQTLEVTMNGEPVGALITDQNALDYKEFRLTGAVFGGATTTKLCFRHPFAARPLDHTSDNRDTRQLAFRFMHLTLAREL